jgi:hypothetical protein
MASILKKNVYLFLLPLSKYIHSLLSYLWLPDKMNCTNYGVPFYVIPSVLNLLNLSQTETLGYTFIWQLINTGNLLFWEFMYPVTLNQVQP